MIKAHVLLAALALSSAPAPAYADASEPADSGWSQLADVQDGSCALQVTGNGQFTRIAATGLGVDAPGRMIVTNGDMKPLDWTIRATGDGRFARYYLPFRWHRVGGEVTVAIQSARCSMATRFAWTRAGVTVR